MSFESIAEAVVSILAHRDWATQAAYPAIPWKTIELLHTSPSGCPLDRVGDAVATALVPVVQAGSPVTPPLVALVLQCAFVTANLRVTMAAAEARGNSADGAHTASELHKALRNAKENIAVLEAEVSDLRQRQLEASERALLLDARLHETSTSLEHRISRLIVEQQNAEQRLAALSAENSVLRERHALEMEKLNAALLDESSRAVALRVAWHAAEDRIAQSKLSLKAGDVAVAAAEFRLRVETTEADSRVAILMDFVADTLRLAACEPFRQVVHTAVVLRRQLLAVKRVVL